MVNKKIGTTRSVTLAEIEQLHALGIVLTARTFCDTGASKHARILYMSESTEK